MALEELRNGILPTRRPGKVYGKRKGILSKTIDTHRDIFICDDAGIADEFGSLTIESDQQPRVTSIANVSPDHDNNLQRRLSKRAERHNSLNSAHLTGSQKPIERHTATVKRWRQPKRLQQTGSGEAICLEPLLHLIGKRAQIQDFVELGANITTRYNILKAGDGSFGECFMLKDRDHLQEISGVLKIIPFVVDAQNAQDHQSSIEDAIQEAKVLRGLETVHGFAQLRGLYVARGRYHSALVKACQDFEQTRKDGFESAGFELCAKDQFHLVIEMEFAGRDLEQLINPSVFEVYDAFWMTTILLAKAEEQLEFEHRDLHMSNICIQADRHRSKPMAGRKSRRTPVILGMSGLKISIIDYTMSRARLGNGEIVYRRLDEENSPEDNLSAIERHQVTTGRRMRELLQNHTDLNIPKTENAEAYLPKTNVIWLAHILFGMLSNAEEHGSRDVVTNNNTIPLAMQKQLWDRMHQVEALINTEDLDLLPSSAQDLLLLAIKNKWLKQADVDAFGECLENE